MTAHSRNSSPENFGAVESLKNGVPVRIRAVRPADKGRVAEAFSRLAPESVYTRFFQPKQSFSDRELAAATEVDFENVVALVVTTGTGEKETIIGGGRYVRLDSSSTPHKAEVAFLVGQNFQGQGIAGRVLKHLAQIAREKGVRQFEADVLPQNRAMLTVIARSGLPMKQHCADGIVHVTLALTIPAKSV